ncbi:MAG: cysteine desulfurase [Clostridia bacterium]|nr:cysteine desulfurase [Clostridia bacterium]
MIYLDNSSTTKPCEKAVENINIALEKLWGNPSSLHLLGVQAEIPVTEARESVAKLLSCRADEVYFTSCGTESNNTAVFGVCSSRKKRGNRIVTTAIEHPSVLEAFRKMENEGFEVIYLKPDKNGVVSAADIENAVNSSTILVSIMLVNNETGAIQPIKAAADAIKKSGAPALLHCDAVQGFGKMPINVNSLGVDLLSVSGHKIHGPKGIGALYMKKGVTLPSLLVGGGQEKGMRSGTESVPLIMGLAGAIDELGNINDNLKKAKDLWLYAKDKLIATGLVAINSSREALPYILNISVEGYRSEPLLHFLESKGIYVSSGSACAKGEGSYVLKEMGLSSHLVDSALRLSFSRFTEKAEIDALCEALTQATQRLRRVK